MDVLPTSDELVIYDEISALAAELWATSREIEGLSTDPKMFSIMLFSRLWSNHRGFTVLWNNKLFLEADIVLRSGVETAICIAANLKLKDTFVALNGPVNISRETPVVAKVPVYFFRQNNILLGIAAQVGLSVGGRDYPAVKDGSYVVTELPPGPVAVRLGHVVGKNVVRQSDETITVRPGGANYFEVSLNKDMIVERPAATGPASVARLTLQADLRERAK